MMLSAFLNLFQHIIQASTKHTPLTRHLRLSLSKYASLFTAPSHLLKFYMNYRPICLSCALFTLFLFKHLEGATHKHANGHTTPPKPSNATKPVIIETGNYTQIFTQQDPSHSKNSFMGLQTGALVGMCDAAEYITKAKNQYWHHQGMCVGYYVGCNFEYRNIFIGMDSVYFRPLMNIRSQPQTLFPTWHFNTYKHGIEFAGKVGFDIRKTFLFYVRAGYSIHMFTLIQDGLLRDKQEDHTMALPHFGFGMEAKLFQGLILGFHANQTSSRSVDKKTNVGFHSIVFKIAMHFS